MSYDNKTNTITVSSNADETSVLMDLGVSHVYELRILARRASASSGLLADWKTIESWLGCAGRELNQGDHAKIADAYRSYFAKGRSPSAELDSIFLDYAKKIRNQNRSLVSVPPQVESVFDRMLATEEQITAKRQLELQRIQTEGDMGKVVLYKNNKFMRCCKIELKSREKVLISIATAPTPSVKIFMMGLFGIFPVQTIWEYNPTMAGGYEAYLRKMMMMFQDPLATESKPPLEILRDRLLPCRSIAEVRDSLLALERNMESTLER